MDQNKILAKIIENQSKIDSKVRTIDETVSGMQDRINTVSLSKLDRKKDVSNLCALSDNRLSYMLASKEYKKAAKLMDKQDRHFSALEYETLLNKANDAKSTTDGFSIDKWVTSLSTREREVYALSLLNEGLIIPEFLGIYNCQAGYTKLSDLYSHIQVSSEEFKYIINMNSDYDYDNLVHDCAVPCQPSDKLEIDFNARVKTGGMLRFESSICSARIGKTYYTDNLRLEVEQVVDVYRKARENALINKKIGWLRQSLNGSGFEMLYTAEKGKISFRDIMTAIGTFPSRYTNLTVVIHPNTFAILMKEFNMLGQPLFSVYEFGDRVYEMLGVKVRFVKSELVPDATQNNTVGGATALPSDSFAFAVADWKEAYTSVSYQELQFKYASVDSFFCDKLLAGAKFSGFVKCPAAGKVVKIK